MDTSQFASVFIGTYKAIFIDWFNKKLFYFLQGVTKKLPQTMGVFSFNVVFLSASVLFIALRVLSL